MRATDPDDVIVRGAPSPLRGAIERSGLLTALACAGFVTLAHVACGTRPRPAMLGFVGLLTLGAYGIDRVADSTRPSSVRGLGIAAILACLSGAVGCALRIEAMRLLGVGAVIVGAVVLYAVPVVPRFGRLKRVPFFKPFYVGIGWVCLIVACSPVSALLVLVFARVVMGAIASDLKDAAEDANEGVRTFPLAFGRDRVARWLAVGHGVVAAAYVLLVVAHALPSGVLLGGVDAAIATLALSIGASRLRQNTSFVTEVVLEAGAATPLLVLLADWPG